MSAPCCRLIYAKQADFPSRFSTTRVPYKDMDKLRHEDNQKHIMIMKNGQVFVFDVYHENGEMYTPAEVELQLKRVEEMST